MSLHTATLSNLLKRFDESPKNISLINEIGIFYMQNTSLGNAYEDLKYFELAYKVKKSVESTNNLAWQLFFEYGDEERACIIQKECIELEPNSYMPYVLSGYILMDRNDCKEAINHLEIAYQKHPQREIIHNIGACYYKLSEFEKAIDSFKQSGEYKDNDNLSLYNLALCYLQTNNLIDLKISLKDLEDSLIWDFGSNVSGYELALIYFKIGDYENSSRVAIKEGLEGIDLLDWKDIAYSIWKSDVETYNNEISKSKNRRLLYIKEILEGHDDWKDDTEEEKQESLKEYQQELIELDNLENNFKNTIPKSKIEVIVEYCGCLLFGCNKCNNPIIDNS